MAITVRKSQFFCGTSNIVLPVRNKTYFPPEFQDKSRLQFYSSLFNSVEVNSTFYKLPLARTVQRWASEAGTEFRFTFKLWKEITHIKELNYDPENVLRFLRIINAAGHSKGSILIQFPASIKASLFSKVRQLLNDIRKSGLSDGWHLAVEFRDPSWYADQVFEMLESFSAGIVRHDMPKSYTPIIDMQHDFVYLRFHGEKGDYRGGYSDDVLADYAEYIRSRTREGLTVYAYFNNTLGDAVMNATTLRAMVEFPG
jgi:uncharacterized protein YecE (DUF72 family)